MLFIQKYFGALLILSCLVGLVMPSAGEPTSIIVMISLAFIIFCTFFQINFDGSLLMKDLTVSLKFWLIRFIAVPVVIFFVFRGISSFYASVLLLSFILPAAVSSPAFTVIYGGKPDLSLKILIFSSFMSVFSIPLIMSWLLGATVHIQTGKMLLTLVYTIVAPFLLHLPLRKMTKIKNVITHYNSLFTLIGLSSIFILVTARNKSAFFDNPEKVAWFAVISFAIYGLMYVLGYYLIPGQHTDIRKTFGISSGANNIGLGVTITALFFQGEMNVFFIISQLIWVVMLFPLKKAFGKSNQRFR
jgi:predicted Na+-dependent transporter